MAWPSGKVLVYDLSRGEHRIDELDAKVLRALLGGRGLASYLVLKYAPRGVDPLASENPLVFAPGLLVGSGLSTASKTTVAAKSPQTGFLGRSAVGARLGLSLRGLGYDALVVLGSLEEPGILVIDENGPAVEGAKDLWGLRVSEARAKLARRYPGYSECVIGPAGENLSAMAAVDCNGRQAGRTGMGAVMGSKRLKAVLVKSRSHPRPGKPEELVKLVRELNRGLSEHPASRTLVEYGTPAMLNYTNKVHGVFPSLNWRRSTLDWCPDPEKAHESLSHWAPKMRKGRNPCVSCARVCSQVVEVEHKGSKLKVDGPEYETVYALGSNIGFCEVEPVAVLNWLADEYGFDTISLGATLAWATEAVERGDLRIQEVSEPVPRWGGLESYARLIELMARREGFLGGLLADGVKKAVERLGKGADYAMHVKGLELPAYDARGLKGMALGYAVSSRGGDHLTSGAYAVEIPGRLWVYDKVDPRSSKGKGLLVKEMENLMAAYDSLGVCKFSRHYLTPERLAPVVSAVTGWDVSAGDLLLAGERAVTIERIYNVVEGLKPSNDTLPPRLLREAIESGPCRGCQITPEELEEMKREYYTARGWDPDTGVPRKARLAELGLLELLGDTVKDLSSG
ncbi:MAG: aldehyde ferredoxin oxidoreductase family protein [Thermoproteota archaeon]